MQEQSLVIDFTNKYNKSLSFTHEEVIGNGTLKKYFKTCVVRLTGVILLQIPLFRIHRIVETLVPSPMSNDHCKAIIGILFLNIFC